MVRHAIFVLVLVGAAFAGGAAINGPGLAWVQRNFIGGPTIIVDGSTPGGEAPRPAKRFPSASPLPLQVDFSSKPPASPTPTAPPQAPIPAPPTAMASNTPPPGFPPEPSVATAARPASATTPPGDLPPLDLPPDPVVASNPTPATTPVPAKADPVARLASAGGLEPASTPAGSTGPGRDWAEARRRLKALGVSRYTIDAEAGGRVRFSCVIPVDGLRAVGHHFEAEGDDEFQAIDATIRRVALWKATEPSRTDP